MIGLGRRMLDYVSGAARLVVFCVIGASFAILIYSVATGLERESRVAAGFLVAFSLALLLPVLRAHRLVNSDPERGLPGWFIILDWLFNAPARRLDVLILWPEIKKAAVRFEEGHSQEASISPQVAFLAHTLPTDDRVDHAVALVRDGDVTVSDGQ